MKIFFEKKLEEAPGIKTFVFKPEKELSFEAGQFAFFNFKLQGKEFTKHFTISSAPTRENIQLTTIVSESEYKKALDSLQERHVVELIGPMGEFTLKKSKGKPIVFLMGGIGITPARSILEFLADTNQDREIVLLYSNRNPRRIIFKQEFEELARKLPSLKIVHALSELDEEQKKEWKGETGFIDKAMIERHTASSKEAVFFTAGPPAFVQAMEKTLKEMKMPAKRIVTEKFTGY